MIAIIKIKSRISGSFIKNTKRAHKICNIIVNGLSSLLSVFIISGGLVFNFKCKVKNAVNNPVISDNGSITIEILINTEPKKREATSSCVIVETIEDINEIV